MKKTKVIIPALGLLLLSTAASVTGTVAWFAANSKVTATGMQIKAKTDSEFLVISKTATLTANDKTVTLEHPTGEVLPTAWVDTNGASENGWEWVTASGTSTSVGTKTGDYTTLSIGESGNFGVAGGKNYYVYDTVYVGLAVGSSTPTGKKLICSKVTFHAEESSELNKCLTIGLDVEADMAHAANFDEKAVFGSNVADEDVNVVPAGATLLAGNALSTTAKAIKIYAFFDGDNANCTTANAINLDGISISLEFSLVDA